MTDTVEAYRAGIDAVIADPTLSMNGFEDAVRTVLTAQFTSADADNWVTAIFTEFFRIGLLTTASYNRLRAQILSAADGDAAEALFFALGVSVNSLPETIIAANSAQLIDLRIDRDNADAAIDRLNVLILAEPFDGGVGKLTKEIMRNGKDLLRGEKQRLRDEIQRITGDPDS